MQDAPAVFEGLRVLDCSSRLSSAFCARLFADFGADVALVEPPSGHPLRARAPFLDAQPGADRSLLHLYANAGKRSVIVQPGDRERLAELVRWADVAVIDGAEHRFEELRALQPRLIAVSIGAYGLGGPLEGAPGNDLTAYAASGWASINGTPDGPPLQGSMHQASYLAGLCAFVGAAAALRQQRAHGGPGQLVDVSELEALAMIAGPPLLQAEYAGAALPRRSDWTRHPVPCKDGHFAIPITRARMWRVLLKALGLPELAEDERAARPDQRHRSAALVQERIRTWERWELFELIATERGICGVVQDMRDVMESPHLAEREFLVKTTLPDGRAARFPGAPFRMSETPWQRRRAAPSLPRALVFETVPSAPPTGSEVPASAALTAPARERDESTPAQQASGPLAGVRALVLTQAWSGTFATELLGLLGAEVIQVEPARRRMDSWRGGFDGAIPPGVRDEAREQRSWNCNPLFNSVNRNKRSITLDLAEPRGRALFRRLVPGVDLVAENFTPRVMRNLGLDYEALCEIKPDIILGSLSAYGASGPLAHIPGIGGTIEPMSGMSSLLGYEGGPPLNSGAMYPDPVSGYYFAAALILALYHRDCTGRGQHIDLGMLEACASFVGDALLEYELNGRVRPRLGNHHLQIAPHNLYPAQGGRWLALAAQSDEAWHALASAIGRPELAADPRFAGMEARKTHEPQLDALLAEWTREQDVNDAARRLLACGVTAAPVLDTRQVLEHEQLRARGFFVPVAHAEVGTHPQTGVPWRFSRTPAAVTRAAPRLGEHSREVLTELAGVSEAQYAELVAAGITGEPALPDAK